ncbi:MAG: efflux RND transporter periplasmic adaptor subunit [Bacteroidota bacterium]|nr:efflux RND transporter periplasmic adaptor subunit [Bacteroidota bacterium]MDP4226162.1 efflux RND transporter periplasmic adaptor subunit [Bacteroidota bacterium]MDP4274419.1 efflux RND transporter periplasmic adaptor subunit [Bacteroidota bacterium]
MKSKKTLRYLIIAVIVLIIIVIIGKKAGWLGKADAIKVSTEKVGRHSIIETITANGKIQPETEVKISPDVSGEIVALYVKEGDSVTKGQLLLKIKPDIYISGRDRAAAAVNTAKSAYQNALARLAQSKAQFEQNKLAYERSKKLWQQKAISQSDWESAMSTYEMSQSDVEAAKQNVKSAEYNIKSADASLKEANENLVKTSIYAPMSGIVSALNVEKGERVVGTSMMAGTEMLRIADLNRMEVKVDVNENDIVRVKVGDTALVEVDAYLDQKFKGTVTEISNSANTTNVSSADQVTNFTVKILLLRNSYRNLIAQGNRNPFRPGMSANVDIQTIKKHNILTVPIQAVTAKSDSALRASAATEKSGNQGKQLTDSVRKEIVFLYNQKDKKVKICEVKTGIQDNYNIEILSGLKEGDEVVVAPYNAISKKLKDGTQVEKVPKEKLFENQK